MSRLVTATAVLVPSQMAAQPMIGTFMGVSAGLPKGSLEEVSLPRNSLLSGGPLGGCVLCALRAASFRNMDAMNRFGVVTLLSPQRRTALTQWECGLSFSVLNTMN